MPEDLSIPKMPRKQIELWDITSTSGNFRPYQIQTANIHFKRLFEKDQDAFKERRHFNIPRLLWSG